MNRQQQSQSTQQSQVQQSQAQQVSEQRVRRTEQHVTRQVTGHMTGERSPAAVTTSKIQSRPISSASSRGPAIRSASTNFLTLRVHNREAIR